MKTLLCFISASLMAISGCNVKKERNIPYLFTKTDKKGLTIDSFDMAYIRGITAIAHLELLKDSMYKIPMPEGNDITIIKRREDLGLNSVDWYGEVINEKESFVFFTYNRKVLNGSISIGKKLYRINYVGNEVYHITELDPDRMTESADDAVVPEYKIMPGDNENDNCSDPSTDLDVMVVYTQAAETGAGGPDAMEVLIYQCLALTNLSYENSNINQRVHLVHFEKVSYTEAANSVTDRAALQNSTDGLMDNVHTLRNTYGADLVALLVETAEPGNCGRAFIMDPVSNAHEAFGFAVIKRSCAVDNKSFTHELGHIMSARHHDDNTNTPFPFCHGFQNLTPADPATTPWRTIMSRVSGAVRIPFFSNPGIQFPLSGAMATDPLGTANREDNHLVLNNTAATIASFRCSSPNVGNVWMKDTWVDTGLEPDPATAAEAMWRSPYIWIRNAQDPTFLHQHEHENPEFGQSNWIYIKMHNGNSMPQTGDLELYMADASVSLTWPGSWTLVDTIPLTLNNNSTKLVEQVWNNVPNPAGGSTHYCIIGRWVSASDPMHVAEGTDINTNVRNNNNIIWRNLNVVDLTSDDEADVILNMEIQPRTSSKIVFEEITNFPKPKFNGVITITFDEKLLSALKRGGNKISGIKSIGNNAFEMTGSVSYLENISFEELYLGKIKVNFKRINNTPHSKFDFSIKHHVMMNEIQQLVGGVDYELDTRKN